MGFEFRVSGLQLKNNKHRINPKHFIHGAIVAAALLWSAAALAQPIRVASVPTWLAHNGGYFAREGVPAELTCRRCQA